MKDISMLGYEVNKLFSMHAKCTQLTSANLLHECTQVHAGVYKTPQLCVHMQDAHGTELILETSNSRAASVIRGANMRSVKCPRWAPRSTSAPRSGIANGVNGMPPKLLIDRPAARHVRAR